MTVAALTETDLFANLPAGLRDELLDAYQSILRNYRERRWEPSELNGGKLCEIIYSILRGYVDSSFPPAASKPRNMVDACRALEQTPSSFPRSVRIQMPRMIMALYEIRNNRGVGHVGGDVDPNHMDATCVLEISKWLMCELIRIFHGVTTEQASNAVEMLVERTIPIVWETGGAKRVLDTSLSMPEKTLVLLYHCNSSVTESDLLGWVEHSNSSVYRRDVLRKLHKIKMLEYDENEQTVEISPLGIARVEDEILG